MKLFAQFPYVAATAVAVVALLTASSAAATTYDAAPHIRHYAALVYANYKDAYADGAKLQSAIAAFLATPSEDTLKSAKDAWLAARNR